MKLPSKSKIISLAQYKITKLSIDSRNYKFTLKSCEIIKLPPSVNGDRTSINGDGKLKYDSFDLGESNGVGGDFPRAAMAADRAPKAVNFPVIIHGQNGG